MIKRSYQSGMMLLEALIGILIFSIGILALVAMQTAAVSSVADAQYRVEAVNLSNQVLANIWTTVDRSSDAAFTASLLNFEHRSTGSPDSCDFQGADSTAAGVVSWYNMIQTGSGNGLLTPPRPLLPGGGNPNYQQIQVDTGTNNRITVTICWLPPNAPPGSSPNRQTTVGYIN